MEKLLFELPNAINSCAHELIVTTYICICLNRKPTLLSKDSLFNSLQSHASIVSYKLWVSSYSSVSTIHSHSTFSPCFLSWVSQKRYLLFINIMVIFQCDHFSLWPFRTWIWWQRFFTQAGTQLPYGNNLWSLWPNLNLNNRTNDKNWYIEIYKFYFRMKFSDYRLLIQVNSRVLFWVK
jgi:hypothetical protein